MLPLSILNSRPVTGDVMVTVPVGVVQVGSTTEVTGAVGAFGTWPIVTVFGVVQAVRATVVYGMRGSAGVRPLLQHVGTARRRRLPMLNAALETEDARSTESAA